jgi:phospholipid/cholesterol/gamma-HCH transport system substrate-binding protein
MASVKTKLAVGLFVVAGFTMVIFAVIWLGMSNYLEKGKFYVAYFDESVQGLDRDSPVKYRGVSIGKVYSIGVAPDANLIEVVLKIETGLKLDKTIVAQLKSVGITGIMFVELEKKRPGDNLVSPSNSFEASYPVIDTRPSEIKKIMEAINDILQEFTKMDINSVLVSLRSMLGRLEQSMNDAQLKTLSEDIQVTLRDIRSSMDPEYWTGALDSVETAADNFDALSTEGRKTITRANATLESYDRLAKENKDEIRALLSDMRTSLRNINRLAGNSNALVLQSNQEIMVLMSEFRKSLKAYDKAGKNLNRFLEQIADHPSQLFLGEPPQDKTLN